MAHGDVVSDSTRLDRAGIRLDKSFSFPGGRLDYRTSLTFTTPRWPGRVQGTMLSNLP